MPRRPRAESDESTPKVHHAFAAGQRAAQRGIHRCSCPHHPAGEVTWGTSEHAIESAREWLAGWDSISPDLPPLGGDGPPTWRIGYDGRGRGGRKRAAREIRVSAAFRLAVERLWEPSSAFELWLDAEVPRSKHALIEWFCGDDETMQQIAMATPIAEVVAEAERAAWQAEAREGSTISEAATSR